MHEIFWPWFFKFYLNSSISIQRLVQDERNLFSQHPFLTLLSQLDPDFFWTHGLWATSNRSSSCFVLFFIRYLENVFFRERSINKYQYWDYKLLVNKQSEKKTRTKFCSNPYHSNIDTLTPGNNLQQLRTSSMIYTCEQYFRI